MCLEKWVWLLQTVSKVGFVKEKNTTTWNHLEDFTLTELLERCWKDEI